jgi:hypothetical protein
MVVTSFLNVFSFNYYLFNNNRSSQHSIGLDSSDKETDTLKEMLIDTNPFLLGVTMVVSMFHTLFDILAFKNDIQFWKKKKDMQGMSLLTLVTNCFFQTVILLYLFDNDTSYVILFSSGRFIYLFLYY